MNMKIIFMLFFIFLVCIIPSSFAEEESEKFIWKNTTLESEYFAHLQARVRNADGSLVSIIETTNCEYLLGDRTDVAWSALPLKQVIEISNQKYEMKQLEQIDKAFSNLPSDWTQAEMTYTVGVYNVGYEYDGRYTAVFHAYPPIFVVEDDHIVTIQWTILKKI